MARVRALLPKLSATRQREVESMLRFAHDHMAMNSFDGMKDSLADLEAVEE
jgi:hypothetical protein